MNAATILSHVPTWVFGLLAGLTAYGVSQMFPRVATLRRMTVMPLALVGLSLYGVVSTFGGHAEALLAWAAGLAVALAALHGRIDTSKVRYDAATQKFAMPGSVWPLVLMLSIFGVKFGAGMAIGLHPALAHSTTFAVIASAAYGLFSGVFLGRAMALWAMARTDVAIRMG